MMFNIKLADIAIGIDNKYEFIKDMCRDYITEEDAQFTVSTTDEEIMAEQENSEERFPPFYLETLAVYRKIAEKISGYGGFLMHGVLMNAEGRGILLTAKSGTGKSTHAALWKQLLGERCEIINGDKPLIRIKEGIPYAYGTPWCGKEGINKNSSVVLTDVFFLNRGKENSVCDVAKSKVAENILPAVHIPSGAGVINVLDSIDIMARNVHFREIFCNMDISAAKVAHDAIMR